MYAFLASRDRIFCHFLPYFFHSLAKKCCR